MQCDDLAEVNEWKNWSIKFGFVFNDASWVLTNDHITKSPVARFAY